MWRGGTAEQLVAQPSLLCIWIGLGYEGCARLAAWRLLSHLVAKHVHARVAPDELRGWQIPYQAHHFVFLAYPVQACMPG